MDGTYRYAQVEPNFNSAYNILPATAPPPTIYYPMYSSTTFLPVSTQSSSSPFFRRTVSPPARPPLSTDTGPKFNFDLYKMNENYDEYSGYTSPTYRSKSPPLTRIIHHYPIHSPTLSPTSETESFSKLRRINDELCRTLARSELIDQSPSLTPPFSPPQYHIHHYPVSRHSYSKHRSRSRSEERPSVTEIEVPTRINKARVTYKIHIPRKRHDHYRKSSRRISPSDGYSSDRSITVDVYPSKDQDSMKQRKYHSDNQSPWLIDGKTYPYDSYPNTKASSSTRISKGPYYGDKPIETYRQSTERPSSSTQHRSPYLNPRIRSNSHRIDDSFSSNAHSPKTRDRIWHPPSRKISEKSTKHFEPVSKPDHDETQSEPRSERKPIYDKPKTRTTDGKKKKSIAEPDNKIKSTWQPTVIGISSSHEKESKPSTPVPIKKPTTDTPPKTKAKSIPSEPTTPIKPVITNPSVPSETDRSSLNDVPTKPREQSTPKDQNDAQENDKSLDDLFDNEPPTPEPPKLPNDSPKIPASQSDKGIKPTTDNGIVVIGNDNNENDQTPTSQFDENQKDEKPAKENDHITPSKPKVQDNESEVDDDQDENDEEVARSFDINKWLSDASKAILGPPKKGPLDLPSTLPSTKPKSPPPKTKPKSPPRRREQPRSPTPDENLYKPPFGPKKIVPKPSTSPPPPPPSPPVPTTTSNNNDDVDEFFS